MSVRNATEMLVLGKDRDGSWTVREGEGLLLGRFTSSMAAHHFAQAERRSRPSAVIASSNGSRPRIAGRLTLSRGVRPRPADMSDA
ncbi:hypothetical protein [Sphingomonas arantia]|uniref:hypothetical protein n=1 Tax=Sphingomonas arantia TaxID=1460676 RepID=UPI0036D273C9